MAIGRHELGNVSDHFVSLSSTIALSEPRRKGPTRFKQGPILVHGFESQSAGVSQTQIDLPDGDSTCSSGTEEQCARWVGQFCVDK